VPQDGRVAEQAGRQVDEQVPGHVEPRQPRQTGKRPRPHVRQTVIGKPQVSKVPQSREDVVREKSDDVPRQRQTQQRRHGVERVRIDVAKSVIV